ncbi:hypothetical protein ACFX2G_047820 [Malus domestica]
MGREPFCWCCWNRIATARACSWIRASSSFSFLEDRTRIQRLLELGCSGAEENGGKCEGVMRNWALRILARDPTAGPNGDCRGGSSSRRGNEVMGVGFADMDPSVAGQAEKGPVGRVRRRASIF